MKFANVCAGASSASVAWSGFNWKPVWFSEIESSPSKVLKKNYPDTINIGDMYHARDLIDLEIIEAPDLIIGGTPCQAFSIGGQRRSLKDSRGVLSLEYALLLDKIDEINLKNNRKECIAIWENVPGVLNVKDNAFGCLLSALVGESEELQPPRGRWSNAGYVFGPKRSAAWRVLDSQYFGVAQRRKRVYLVTSARDGFDPREILFESESVRGNATPTRESPLHVCITARGAGSLDDRETYIVEKNGRPRRPTPIEYERLRGFSDGYTDIGKGDACRYKIMGNSATTHVLKWIGERIKRYTNE